LIIDRSPEHTLDFIIFSLCAILQVFCFIAEKLSALLVPSLLDETPHCQGFRCQKARQVCPQEPAPIKKGGAKAPP
jgi:hypothetical protein